MRTNRHKTMIILTQAHAANMMTRTDRPDRTLGNQNINTKSTEHNLIMTAKHYWPEKAKQKAFETVKDYVQDIMLTMVSRTENIKLPPTTIQRYQAIWKIRKNLAEILNTKHDLNA